MIGALISWSASLTRRAAELHAKGLAGLKKAGRAGRKPRLSAEQINQIERGLKRGPQALGYETSLWTANRVVHLIEQECAVSYHPGHVWKILRWLGWSSGDRRAGLWSVTRKPSSAGRRSAGRGHGSAKRVGLQLSHLRGMVQRGDRPRLQQHELLLLAARGSPPAPTPPDRVASVIRSRRGPHSEKPQLVYEMIERIYPALPKLELFAGRRREGWSAWGNQAAADSAGSSANAAGSTPKDG
jgi:hypothetical protein